MNMLLKIQGLDCANCASEINSELKKLSGVSQSEINFMGKKLNITVDDGFSREYWIKKIQKKISSVESGVIVGDALEAKKPSTFSEIIRIVLGIIIFAAAILFNSNHWLEITFFVTSYIIVGGDVVIKACKNIIKGKALDENFLMSIATIGAFAIGDHAEAVAVMLFYQIGELFQTIAINRSRKSIADLMDIRPDYANLVSGEEIFIVNPESVAVGQEILVKPGEKIPLDGIIQTGNSTLDTKALTGESIPKEVSAGETVLSGCINLTGTITLKVKSEFAQSTVAKILQLVEDSGSKKAETENIISRFSKIYTPIVVILAILLAIIPTVILGQEFSVWGYRALVFLVISCPCALVISVPLSFFGGIGGASKCGILVKGSNYLEALSKCDTVVFDKTGTLTKGVFDVIKINPINVTSQELLELAAAAENFSNHPIAISIKSKYGNKILSDIVDATEIPGKGISTKYKGNVILAGNSKLMSDYGITPENDTYGTTVHVAKNGNYVGYITISDVIKDDSERAVKMLKSAGVMKTVMLTGDAKPVAMAVGEKLGIDEIYYELMPADKVSHIETLLANENPKRKLAFVGDGINDAPVLARADIGIAMGGLGSDAAIEAADVVLMTDEPSRIATGMKISRKTIRIVKQNIIFALSIKIIILILGALGFATMWAAVFADVGVTVIAILNAFRCLNVKKFQE